MFKQNCCRYIHIDASMFGLSKARMDWIFFFLVKLCTKRIHGVNLTICGLIDLFMVFNENVDAFQDRERERKKNRFNYNLMVRVCG